MIRLSTFKLTHAGPKTVDREAELRRPSGVVCSDFVRRAHSPKYSMAERACSRKASALSLSSGQIPRHRMRKVRPNCLIGAGTTSLGMSRNSAPSASPLPSSSTSWTWIVPSSNLSIRTRFVWSEMCIVATPNEKLSDRRPTREVERGGIVRIVALYQAEKRGGGSSPASGSVIASLQFKSGRIIRHREACESQILRRGSG